MAKTLDSEVTLQKVIRNLLELRIPLSEYTSGGSLKEGVYEDRMMEGAGTREESIKKLANLKKARDFAKNVTASDLYVMAQFHRRQKG